MSDYVSTIAQHSGDELSVTEQKKIGQPIGDDMDEEQKQFLALLIGMIDREEIDVRVPSSFLKHENYDRLPEKIRSKIDVMLVNMADELRKIEEFFRSKETPNAAPQLQTMIQFFKAKKEKTEKVYGDVFKF